MPPSSLVHPIFHVSQLKQMVGDHQPVTADLPDPLFQWSVPEAILQRRSINRGMSRVSQVLIKWSHVPASLATWEDAEALRQQFPNAAVWGHPASPEGGGVIAATPSKTSDPMNGPRRTSRPKKTNTKYSGPEWV